MAKFDIAHIRNVALMGHGTCGKTLLIDALLLGTKTINRLGSIKEGTTTCDYDEVEKSREHSILASNAYLEWKNHRINLIDTPGYPDFFGEIFAALPVIDTAILCVDAQSGVKVNTRKCWKLLEQANIPRFIAINRLDLDQSRFWDILTSIRDSFGDRCIPLFVPDGEGSSFTALESVLEGTSDKAEEFKDVLIEAIVEADEALMEKYLEGEELTKEELASAFSKAMLDGTIYPIIPTSAEKGLGVTEILDSLVKYGAAPDALPRTAKKGEEDIELKPTDPFCAKVWKTIIDPYVGKLSYLRVYSGELKTGSSVKNSRTGNSNRIGNMYHLQGKETNSVDTFSTGMLCAISKVDDIEIGDTITDPNFKVSLAPYSFPEPMVSLAVEPKSRGDEQKMAEGLRKLADQDPTFHQGFSAKTRELVITGMSTLHLDIALSRLKKAGIEVETRTPKTPYMETITSKSEAHYRHKKQSGGSGEFGEVHMRIEPLGRGEGFEYANEVKGGNIPIQYIPSVEKGINWVMERGQLAGYPIVDIKAVVYDGKHHPVDSKDMAFQKAGRGAFQEAFDQAKPVLLEPIVNIEITIPTSNMGDIMGDITGRRGQIRNSITEGDWSTIEAQVPMAEIKQYSTELRSMTGGEGSYTIEVSHHDVVPAHIAGDVIKSAKKTKEED